MSDLNGAVGFITPTTIPQFQYTIENVFATATMVSDSKIDLNIISTNNEFVKYDPTRFPGAIMRLQNPKSSILLFSTGKMVMSGMHDTSEAALVANEVVHQLNKSKIHVKSLQIQIQNIVVSGDMKCQIDLDRAAILLESCIYEPESYPGLIYRVKAPQAIIFLFASGRILCMGVKSIPNLKIAIEHLYHRLEAYNLFKPPSNTTTEGEGEEEEMVFL